MLERDKETEDTEAKINELRGKIYDHNKHFPMKSFHTEDTQGNRRKCPDRDVDDRSTGTGGGAGGVDATDCAELEAHGYEVEPQEVVDENGYVIIEPFFKVYLCRPLSIYAPR
jgi:hypothetical protein